MPNSDQEIARDVQIAGGDTRPPPGILERAERILRETGVGGGLPLRDVVRISMETDPRTPLSFTRPPATRLARGWPATRRPSAFPAAAHVLSHSEAGPSFHGPRPAAADTFAFAYPPGRLQPRSRPTLLPHSGPGPRLVLQRTLLRLRFLAHTLEHQLS
jgi:hypothetical protein